MKFIVPTYTRVGSTWVCEVLRTLLGEEQPFDFIQGRNSVFGSPATEEELDKFRESESQVLKTHTFAPLDLLELTKEPDGCYIIVCRRNFMDAFVSKCLYERKVRIAEGLGASIPYARVLNEYPTITDPAYVNLVVESDPEYVRRQMRGWKIATHVIAHEKVIVVNYDKLALEPHDLVRLFSRVTKTTPDKVKVAMELSEIANMRKKYPNGFVRKGQPGDYKNFLDKSTISWIEQELEKLNKKRMVEL